jgi:hypothetical protein
VYLFPPLADETRRLLDQVPALIDKTFPLPRRFRAFLSADVAELSRLLTGGRTERDASYLGKPKLLSAYLRYFLPWNLYRLCRLLPALPLNLAGGDAVNDLGSGPLTLVLALWISRPDLRALPLEFRCLDRTGAALDAGKALFFALTAAQECPWTVRTIKAEIKSSGALSAEIRGKPAALSAAVNVWNEIFWNLSPADTAGLRRLAGGSARLLASLTAEAGLILAVEPGIPRSGEFIACLREALGGEGRPPLLPCPHAGPCPFPGGLDRSGGKAAGKSRWCHFPFDTEDAPQELRALSAAAGIPKDRAVLSFLLAGLRAEEHAAPADRAKTSAAVRIVSDSFPVGREGRYGRYGCSENGMVLAAGTRTTMDASPPGTLAELPLSGETDPKTGAPVALMGANTQPGRA